MGFGVWGLGFGVWGLGFGVSPAVFVEEVQCAKHAVKAPRHKQMRDVALVELGGFTEDSVAAGEVSQYYRVTQCESSNYESVTQLQMHRRGEASSE